MAETLKPKEIQTRIALKYDTYVNWTTHNPVLLRGEVAVATVPTGTTATDGTTPLMANLPNVVMKVGNGTNRYNDLPFVSALAADVYEWAKSETKPTYSASEIVDLAEYIDDRADVDSNTKYTIVPVEGTAYKFELKYKELTDTEFKSFDSPVYIDLSILSTVKQTTEDNRAFIETIQGGVTDKSMAEMVAAGLSELNTAEGGITNPEGDGLHVTIVQENGLITGVNAVIDAETYDEYGAATRVKDELEKGALKNLNEAIQRIEGDGDTSIQGKINSTLSQLELPKLEGVAAGTTLEFV
jgi:hypothetical protein